MARDYAKVAWRFWTSRTGKRLRGDPIAQLVALYLLTCQTSTMYGLYQISVPTIAHDIGIEEHLVVTALARLESEEFAYYDSVAELVLVLNMAQFQIAETLQANDNRVKNLRKEVGLWSKHFFARKFWARYEIAFHLGPWPFQAPLAPSEGLQRSFEGPSWTAGSPFGSPLQAPPKPGSGSGSGSGYGDPDPDARDPSAPALHRTTDVDPGPLPEGTNGTNGSAPARAERDGSDAGATIIPISQPTPQKPPSGAMPAHLPIPGSEPTSAKLVNGGATVTVPQPHATVATPAVQLSTATMVAQAAKLRPDTAHNLVWCLKVAVEKFWVAKQVPRGFWTPGRFGENDSARWWLGTFGDREVTPAEVDTIEQRISLYTTSEIGQRHGWSLKGFLEDFNRIGLEPAKPATGGRKPLSQQLGPGQRFFDPNEEDPD